MSPRLFNTFSLISVPAFLAGPLVAGEPLGQPILQRAASIRTASQLTAETAPPPPTDPVPATSAATAVPPPPENLAPSVPITSPAYSPVMIGSGYGYANGSGAIYGTPGGYEGRIGSPYHYFDPNGGQFVNTGNPYYDHFGPGYHRQQLYGHYRFPYYNYRAPWYYPGRAVYNRDTNFAW